MRGVPPSPCRANVDSPLLSLTHFYPAAKRLRRAFGYLFKLMKVFYHGTKADLRIGDEIVAGYNSNYGQRKQAKYVYFSATLDAAVWGAELAVGEGRGRIYIVEPTHLYEDDPNLTDKKFAGNPTKSYRSLSALRVVGEVAEWQGHQPEQLAAMQTALARLKAQGIEAIED